MKAPARHHVYTLARQALLEIYRRRAAVVVWWDIEHDEFHVMRADGLIGRILLRHALTDAVSVYAGEFGCDARQNEIQEALQAHVDRRFAA